MRLFIIVTIFLLGSSSVWAESGCEKMGFLKEQIGPLRPAEGIRDSRGGCTEYAKCEDNEEEYVLCKKGSIMLGLEYADRWYYGITGEDGDQFQTMDGTLLDALCGGIPYFGCAIDYREEKYKDYYGEVSWPYYCESAICLYDESDEKVKKGGCRCKNFVDRTLCNCPE